MKITGRSGYQINNCNRSLKIPKG